MSKKNCIAMLLAGGQGTRLYDLTESIAKPAVSFGGKYRIIDFSLSNCINSGIDTVGILVQYRPGTLTQYLGNGEAWDLDISNGGVHVLSPYATQEGGAWYYLDGDGAKADRAWEGSIDLFYPKLSDRGDAVEDIEETLEAVCGDAWELNSTQYENSTGLFHVEWVFQVVNTPEEPEPEAEPVTTEGE